jgi:hypothetical protein
MAAAAEEGRPATKYVLITGGVVSGLGKGVTASSVGVVLKSCGLRVTCIKIGPLPLPLPLPLHVFSPPALRDSWLGFSRSAEKLASVRGACPHLVVNISLRASYLCI